jgi:hypothetical protein
MAATLVYTATFASAASSSSTLQVGTVQQGVQYADELPKLHKEIKRDVSWFGATNAQLEITIKKACHLTLVVQASQGCAAVHFKYF